VTVVGARWRQPLFLLAGIGAIVGASLIGRLDTMGVILEPPLVGRVLFGAAAVILGVVLGMRAIERFGAATGDARALIRAVRLVFLSLAAFAAAAGWFIGSALPIVVALVIAGIDVIETTLLLLVVSVRGDDASEADGASPGPHAAGGTATVLSSTSVQSPHR